MEWYMYIPPFVAAYMTADVLFGIIRAVYIKKHGGISKRKDWMKRDGRYLRTYRALYGEIRMLMPAEAVGVVVVFIWCYLGMDSWNIAAAAGFAAGITLKFYRFYTSKGMVAAMAEMLSCAGRYETLKDNNKNKEIEMELRSIHRSLEGAYKLSKVIHSDDQLKSSTGYWSAMKQMEEDLADAEKKAGVGV